MPLIVRKAGVIRSYTGLDYCPKLLRRFQSKLDDAEGLAATKVRLVCGDARSFDLGDSFDLVFIGCHSLSKVILNSSSCKSPWSLGRQTIHGRSVQELRARRQHYARKGF